MDERRREYIRLEMGFLTISYLLVHMYHTVRTGTVPGTCDRRSDDACWISMIGVPVTCYIGWPGCQGL
jgi:hypothetical protein